MPALKGRTKNTKRCAPPPPFPFYHLERTPMLYLPPCKGRTFSTAGQHQLKGISLSASGQHQLLRGDPCLQLVNPSSKWDIHVYSWPTPAIKGRSSLQKGRFYSWSTPALKGRTKKTKACATPPPLPFYHLERTPMLYLLQQLYRGEPILQLVNTS